MNDIDNPSNAAGISALFNHDTVSNAIKLDETEKNIIDDTSVNFMNSYIEYSDPIQEYKDKAERINNNLNLVPNSLSGLNEVEEIDNFLDIDDDIKDELNVINSMINNNNS